jgi:hypothetical protein
VTEVLLAEQHTRELEHVSFLQEGPEGRHPCSRAHQDKWYRRSRQPERALFHPHRDLVCKPHHMSACYEGRSYLKTTLLQAIHACCHCTCLSNLAPVFKARTHTFRSLRHTIHRSPNQCACKHAYVPALLPPLQHTHTHARTHAHVVEGSGAHVCQQGVK